MPFALLPHAFFTLPDGGKLRYARFQPTGKPRGTVLIIPGRREFIEKKFAELGQGLLDSGLCLVIVEPRSQGLSSRFLSGDQRQRDHIDSFNTHLDDLRAFYRAIVQPGLTVPLFLHGHSLGGHLALRWLAEDRPAVAAAFLTAPMLALSSMPAHLAAHGLSWLNVRLFGHVTDYAPTQHDFDASDGLFANNPLTQDAARFQIIEHYFTAHPDLAVGGVTWGWMLAALRSMQVTHAQTYLAQIPIPVLTLVGGQDRVTPAAQIIPGLNTIPRGQTHIIAASRHDVMNESDLIRTEAWREIGAFINGITA